MRPRLACHTNSQFLVEAVYNYSMDLEAKLAILADAAKYDAACASSGALKRSASPGRGMGSITGMAFCHSYTSDGRWVSLLNILLINVCLYDCVYCVNRRSSDVDVTPVLSSVSV